MKTNSEPQDMFSNQMEAGRKGELIFSIEIPGRLPSWNDILGMEQWARYKFKKELADAFLSALKASAADCSTKITSQKNGMWIYADILESYLATQQAKRRLKLRNKRLAAKNPNASELKFTEPSKVPF